MDSKTTQPNLVDQPPNQSELMMDEFKPSRFKPLRLLFFVFIIILFISQAIQWYSHSVTIPRYCDDKQQALHYLELIITKRSPAGAESRRPYIIAAKLIYLIPRQSNESVANYIHRVSTELSQRCMR